MTMMADSSSNGNNKNKRGHDEMRGPVPVTVLSGFLGAGKTTLLKYILETKHKETGGGGNNNSNKKGSNSNSNNEASFRCAVVVNDMAELNIDESLIVDQSSDVVQSNDVVALQNGCVCCTLQNDLVEQITKLAASGNYDYMIIEASGVAEPAEIAKLFKEDCEEDHDHSEHHGHNDGDEDGNPRLSQVSRLDTLVTVVDASALLETNQELWLGTSTVVGPTNSSAAATTNNKNNLSQLMAEQVEYANVILINKKDLVTEAQLEEVINTRIRPLNTHATLLTCKNSQIDDVHKVVDTRSYRPETFGFEQLVNELQVIAQKEKKDDSMDDELACCAKSKADGLAACCPSNNNKKNTFDSGLSQVVLASQGGKATTRHDSRFGITSFLYKARRPFHPDRFNKEFIAKYFLYYDPEEEEDEEDCDEQEDGTEEAAGQEEGDMEGNDDEQEEGGDMVAEPTKTPEEIAQEKQEKLEAYHKVAKQRQAHRTKEMGMLLRTKGFLWLADSHDMLTSMSHAGNLVTIDSSGHWTALNPKAYEGTKEEKEKLCKQWEGKWKDRRQELVFIGQKLNHKYIQALLDECLLDDEEFDMGVDYWKATMGDNVLEISATTNND